MSQQHQPEQSAPRTDLAPDEPDPGVKPPALAWISKSYWSNREKEKGDSTGS